MDQENVLSKRVAELYDSVNANNSNTCKDCKWWGRDEYHYCENPNIGVKGKFNDDCAWSEDPFCSIQTGPDFGCIHWEKKDE